MTDGPAGRLVRQLSRPPGWAVAVTIAGAGSFGAVISVVHGSSGGVRAAVGNVSAPWLLLPFAAAALAGGTRLARGLVLEPFALVAYFWQRASLSSAYEDTNLAVWIPEMAIGLSACAGLCWRRRRLMQTRAAAGG